MALSQRELDCLVAVESLSDAGWPARVSDVARKLNVKAPTAVEMLFRLEEKGIFEKGPGGVRISKHGNKLLREIYRAHRIFEIMLTKMGMTPDGACKESTKVDRYPSREAVNAICSYLGHPKTCPHNLPIDPDPMCCKTTRRRR